MNTLHTGAVLSEHAPPNSLYSHVYQGGLFFIPHLHPKDTK